jgi:hypothetical protein
MSPIDLSLHLLVLGIIQLAGHALSCSLYGAKVHA